MTIVVTEIPPPVFRPWVIDGEEVWEDSPKEMMAKAPIMQGRMRELVRTRTRHAMKSWMGVEIRTCATRA